MATYPQHEWLIFANTIAESGRAGYVVITAVCQRCGDFRSSSSPGDGSGRIDLTGECDTGDSGSNVTFGAVG